MKKFFNSILLILLVFLACFAGGCSFVPPSTDEDVPSQLQEALYPNGTISGYKACYKSSSYTFGQIFENYSKKLITNLYNYFTFTEIDQAQFETKNVEEKLEIVLNLDRVRYQIKHYVQEGYNYVEKIKTPWNWTFGTKYGFVAYFADNYQVVKVDNNGFEDALNEIHSGYKDQNDKISSLISIYSIALEYNIYEIALGRTPTAPVIEISSESLPNVTVGGFKIEIGSDGVANRENVLSDIQAEFASYGSYIGLSERDRTAITDYILEEVVGEQIVNNPQFNKGSEYQTRIAEFVNIDPADTQNGERSFFDPYPASNIKDFSDTTFYINGGIGEDAGAGNTFSHIPANEYQSLVIMPEQEVEFITLMLAFNAETEMSAVLRVRYYDATSKTLYETAKQNITISGRSFDALNDIVMVDLVPTGLSDTVVDTSVDMRLDTFDNNMHNGALKAPEEKIISGELANYYNIIDSDNGYGAIGVLNHNKINFSYMEIVIDLEKDPQTPKAVYPFKMGVVGIIPAVD